MEKKRDDAQNTDNKKNPVHEKSDPSYVTKSEDAVTDVDLANEKTIAAEPGDAGAGGPADPASAKHQSESEDRKGSKGRVVAAVVVVAAIAAGGYYYAQNNTLSNPPQNAAQSDSADATDKASGTADTAATTPGDNATQNSVSPSTTQSASGDVKPETEASPSTDTTVATPSDTSGNTAEKSSPSPDSAASPDETASDTSATPAQESETGTNATATDNPVSDQAKAEQAKAADNAAEGAKSAGPDQSEPAESGAADAQAPESQQDKPTSAGAADTQTGAQATGESSINALPSDIRDQLQRQSSQIIALRDQLEASERRLQQLQTDRLQISRNQTSLFVLNDVSRLVGMAQNELAIAGNLQNAVRSLETARDAIARANAPVLSGLQAAIASDIVTLKSSPVASVDALFGQVNALSQKLDTLPMIAPDQVGASPMTRGLQEKAVTEGAAAEPESALPADAAWYDRAWNEVRQWPAAAWSGLRSDLGGIVRVEKLSDPNQVLLTVDQAMQLRNNLKQNLHFAQQALLNGQQGIWTASLETVVKGLKSSFNQDSSETQQALAQAQDLLKQTVRPTMPELAQSVRAVQETRKQLESLSPAQE